MPFPLSISKITPPKLLTKGLSGAYGLFRRQQDLRGLLLTSAHLLDLSLYRSNPAITIEIQIKRAEELLQKRMWATSLRLRFLPATA